MKTSNIAKGCLVNGEWVEGSNSFDVTNKFDLSSAATIHGADAKLVNRAVKAARAAYKKSLSNPYERFEILLKVRDLVAERRELFRDTLVIEAGFPAKDADGEINRALQTLTLSAEEAKRLNGETVPFSGAPTGQGRIGFTIRVPLGLIAAITPFNAPLNTVAHKVAPAYAGGNMVLLKPSDKTPLTSALLAQCFIDAGAAPGTISVLQGGVDVAQALLAEQDIAFYAFTGSTAAGKSIQAAAGVRRTQMELGSVASTIVMNDTQIDVAAAKCAGSSFRKAGQVCTSIQTLMIHEDVYSEFKDSYLENVKNLIVGDPSRQDVDVGPMISVEAAERVEALINDQTHDIVLGGKRKGAVIEPTVLENLSNNSPLFREEIFGPVTCLIKISNINDAIDRINSTPFGLATGLFTNSIKIAFLAAQNLEVGGVHINETCSSRVDLMPYGGVKDSGFGQEGPSYAVHEMTEERLVTFSGLDK